jgi:hypothetical protein
VSLPLSALVVTLNLLVWGAHARLPWQLATEAGDGIGRRLWTLGALPALGLSALATLLAVRAAPDAALAWRLTDLVGGALPARLLGIAAVALALVDLVLLAGGARLGAREWRLAGVFGALALAAQTLGSELVRIGWGPLPRAEAVYAAAALRLPLALAAGELVGGRLRLWTTLAGPALAAAVFFWPESLRRAMGGELRLLPVAALLLLAARWLPASLRRPAAAAGLVLAALLLARAGQVGAILGGAETVPDELLGP